jgi:Na+-transporting NADH:ubiquinone oxidoreductase subunit E
MNTGAEISQAFVVCISAVFTQNILLTYFLGLCPFLGVSREVKTSMGLGLAVIFVLTSTCMINWLIYHYVLVPLGLEFFRFILFIIIIAAFVQLVEMVLDRYSPFLYQQLGVFLPLITVNCAILGASAGIRQKLANDRIPQGLQGPGITLIIAGLMALAFMGFSGVLQGT